MQTTKYDPAVIQKFADKLYSLAEQIVLFCAVVGAILGAVVGHVLAVQRMPNAITAYEAVGACILGLLGFAIGQSIAFVIRLQAQIALCQMKIEENTRAETKVAAQATQPATSLA